MRAVNPANISGGFKRSGVCPHDPTAVLITGSGSDGQAQSPPGCSIGSGSSCGVGDQSSNQVTTQALEGGTSEGNGLEGADGASVGQTTNETSHVTDRGGTGDVLSQSHCRVDSFIPKQLELFERRFKEGYDPVSYTHLTLPTIYSV